MPNSLTGDFDAVLQISAGTLRRLVANMHQNAFVNSNNPSIPHVVYLRVEDDPVPGQRGSIAAQIGAPYLHLIHGATDRFRIEFGIRARYRPDPGTLPLADLIHGTVSAEYRLQDIDPTCWGWRGISQDYFWFRVVKDSVGFDGNVLNESASLVLTHLLDEPQVRGQVTRHLAAILARQFEPEPQRVNKRFQRFRSLSIGNGPGEAAIAIPYGLGTETPAGNLTSVGRIFLNGQDCALAVSADAITARVQPFLDPVVGWQVNVHHEVDAGAGGGLIVDYAARIDTASAEWLGASAIPLIPGGLMRVRLTGVGWASRLYRSGVFMLEAISASDLGTTFTIDQYIRLSFNPATEFLSVGALGAPIVDVKGGPKADYVIAAARSEILKNAPAQLAGPIAAAQAEIDAMGAADSRGALVQSLKSLDISADAHFTGAVFDSEGVVLCGPVGLTHRYRPNVSFVRTPSADGFDAIESWIPGGRVDSFAWSWKWFTSPVERPPGPPGASTEEDSFMLRRSADAPSRFGLALAREEPLPGLDGNGKVCLTVTGVHVDPFTGVLVPVTSNVECEQFGYEFKLPYEVGPYVRVCDPLRLVDGRAPEIGVLRVGVAATVAASNTLVVYFRERLDEEAVRVLRHGLDASRAEHAGLLVVLVFRDGALEGDRELQSRIDDVRRHLSAPLLVTEDVRAGWSTALAIPSSSSEVSWRLVNPSGALSWAHDGRVDAQILARMLDTRLVASPPPTRSPIRAGIELGLDLPIALGTPGCPPAPLRRGGAAGSKLVFVSKDTASTRDVLERIRSSSAARDEERPYVAVVLEGADAREADALRHELNLEYPLFPDQSGELTRRVGVRFSPTTLTLDYRGIVTGLNIGAEELMVDPDSFAAAD